LAVGLSHDQVFTTLGPEKRTSRILLWIGTNYPWRTNQQNVPLTSVSRPLRDRCRDRQFLTDPQRTGAGCRLRRCML